MNTIGFEGDIMQNQRLFSEEEFSPWRREWREMPPYEHDNLAPKYEVMITCRSKEDVEDLARMLRVTIPIKGARRLPSVTFPVDEIARYTDKRYRGIATPRYPIYIPSKGRAENQRTMSAFDALGIDYTVFVEPQEYTLYRKYWRAERLHVLPFSDRGLKETRNYIWDYADGQGAARFWTFDDNIHGLFYYQRNLKTPCDATALAVIEDFVDRYDNIDIAGMNYFMFVTRKYPPPPIKFNTRVYSNMLIRTDAKDTDGKPLRNKLFFNDDTDLCLRVLKAGRCTALFSQFLIDKEQTMKLSGGMTEYYKQTDRRREFTRELVDAHPDIAHETEKFGRVHHHVDYRRFKTWPRRIVGPIPRRDYGLVLECYRNGEWRSYTGDEHTDTA